MWSLPVHPTQIYEAAACLAISAFCLVLVHPRKRYDGQVFVSFVLLYAVARFVLEIWRRDDRGGVLGLSTSQALGLAFIALALVTHVIRRPRGAGDAHGLTR
jgi:phosphatidylglycerol:prolipoprotein diacylglycerol transferase